MYIDAEPYFKITGVAKEVGVHPNTLRLWDKYSDILEAEGQDRLIPKPYLMGVKGIRYWSKSDIKEIISYKNKDKFGDLAYFNRAQWGKRGHHLPSYKNPVTTKGVGVVE